MTGINVTGEVVQGAGVQIADDSTLSATVSSPSFDAIFGSTPGAFIYRGFASWTALSPGAIGQVLQSGGANGTPSWLSPSGMLDSAFGTAQGSILYRGASGWAALAPGSSSRVLQSGGASANPSWLALGTAAALNVGTAANDVVQLDAGAKLPAVDGSQLTNVGTALSYVSNILGADVSVGSVNFVDGPSVAQGSNGVWFAAGQITIVAPSGTTGAQECVLWDGTTVIASSSFVFPTSSLQITLSLSGVIASPSGNIRMSVKGAGTGGNLTIKANASGEGKDSTVFAVRIG